ncbi:MAG: D-inositol-3-phosphate glycosyltransferase [Fimbriimonadales bacterium]|nr:D-inositol-3-phosphate glycosyltransferase [Fimbriimonadales bacterium]
MPGPLCALDASLVGTENTGDSAYWAGLIGALGRVAPNDEFLLLSNAQPPSWVSDLPANLRWIVLPPRPGRWLSAVTMPLAAKRLGARTFHTQYSLSPLARNGVTTIHDVSFFVGPEWFRWKDRLLLRALVPGSARRARKVITVSEASKADIVRHLRVPAQKVAVTYNAPDPRFQPVGEADQEATLERLGIRRPFLLTIGTRWPRKNLRLAIAAAGMLPESLPHRLVVVGKQGWGEEGSNPRVVATGYVPNDVLPALYSAADLYLCPSHYEGFGIPIVEAFACGTPVITSPGGALREVAGGAAEVMDDWTAEAWSSKIVELLSDSSKLHAMRERGLARARDFSWEKTAALTVDVYREAAGD